MEIGDEAPFSLDGFLWKFSTGRSFFGSKNWKERWFVGESQALQYFEKPGGKLSGALPYNTITFLHPTVTTDIHPNATDPTFFYFGVRFINSGKQLLLLLRARTELERTQWVDFLARKLGPKSIGLIADLEEEDDETGPLFCRKARANGTEETVVATVESPTVPKGKDGEGQSKVKSMVSKNKLRFNKDNFDLDLTYINPNIIAMGFPSEGKEALYRNRMEDVEQFFSFYHKDHFRIYNLCSERQYDHSKFGGSWEHFPFDDHNPPPLTLILPFCESVHRFLESDQANVVAVHCKAGKGRTGTMIASYLLFSGQFTEAEKALQHFGANRTKDCKGVTIPSQIRYVHYFEKLIMSPERTVTTPTYLVKCLTLHSTPHFDRDGGCDPYFIIFGRDGQDPRKLEQLYDSRSEGPPKHFVNAVEIPLRLSKPVKISADVKFCFFDQDTLVDDPMFHFWLHTAFFPADSSVVRLEKKHLDAAVKDKANEEFDAEFAVSLEYELVP